MKDNFKRQDTCYWEEEFIIAPKQKKIIKKKKKFSKEKVFVFAIFFFLLFCVFPYSFNLYIRDVFSASTIKNLKLDYQKVMYPANSLVPSHEFILDSDKLINVKYDETIMVDIPESFERIRLKNELLALADNYKRIHPSIYVWEYNGKSYVDINADEPFPAASIIKVPVLIEMFRNIEHNKFSLTDKMILEDYYRAPGSGKLQYSQGGIAHTLDYLARIMIENSDNSSTNMIMSKIGGMPRVNHAIHRWGLKTTSVNNWLPDLDGTNLTTAREMATMFYNIDVTGVLTNTSKRQIADYLSHVKNTRLLKAGLPDDAKILHKTGDIGFMLGDAGIVKAKNGKKYIVVILARRPYNSLQGKEFIVKASKLIYNNIVL